MHKTTPAPFRSRYMYLDFMMKHLVSLHYGEKNHACRVVIRRFVQFLQKLIWLGMKATKMYLPFYSIFGEQLLQFHAANSRDLQKTLTWTRKSFEAVKNNNFNICLLCNTHSQMSKHKQYTLFKY